MTNTLDITWLPIEYTNFTVIKALYEVYKWEKRIPPRHWRMRWEQLCKLLVSAAIIGKRPGRAFLIRGVPVIIAKDV